MACSIQGNFYAKTSTGGAPSFWYASGMQHGLFIIMQGSVVWTTLTVKLGTKLNSWEAADTMLSVDATSFPPKLSENDSTCIPADSHLVLKNLRGNSYHQWMSQTCCHQGVTDDTMNGDGAQLMSVKMSNAAGPLLVDTDYNALAVDTKNTDYNGWGFSLTKVTARSPYLGLMQPGVFDLERTPVTLRFVANERGEKQVKYNRDYIMYATVKATGSQHALRTNNANSSIGIDVEKDGLKVRITNYSRGTPCGEPTELVIESTKNYPNFPAAGLDKQFGALICCQATAAEFWARQQMNAATFAIDSGDFFSNYSYLTIALFILIVVAVAYYWRRRK